MQSPNLAQSLVVVALTIVGVFSLAFGAIQIVVGRAAPANRQFRHALLGALLFVVGTLAIVLMCPIRELLVR